MIGAADCDKAIDIGVETARLPGGGGRPIGIGRQLACFAGAGVPAAALTARCIQLRAIPLEFYVRPMWAPLRCRIGRKCVDLKVESVAGDG